jgi:uncharacterized protein (TIGR02757 family)
VRIEELRLRLNALYAHYDHRFVDPDPLEFPRREKQNADREVVGLLASSLAYGGVGQIKRSIFLVRRLLGDRPAEAVRALEPGQLLQALKGFRHRFNDARDLACLLLFVRRMLEEAGSIEAFFLKGFDPEHSDVGPALASFAARALSLDHEGLYGRGRLPADAGVRFFFPSPVQGSACKRLNLYLRWMARHDGVDLGVWRGLPAARLVIPLDAHIYTIARRVRLTRYKSPGWAMALDITKRLRRLDPEDPVKYDFALHRMGLFRREEEIRSLKGETRSPGRADPARKGGSGGG